MKKKYVVRLSEEERKRLKGMVSKGKAAARAIRRAQILLKSAEGWTDAAISEAVGIRQRRVEQIRKQFTEIGVDETVKGQAGRKVGTVERALDGEAEARLIALACSEPPLGHARWTLRLLAKRMVALEYVESVSHETVRGVLKKTNLSLG